MANNDEKAYSANENDRCFRCGCWDGEEEMMQINPPEDRRWVCADLDCCDAITSNPAEGMTTLDQRLAYIRANEAGHTGYQAIKLAMSCAAALVDADRLEDADELIRSQMAKGLTGNDLHVNLGRERVARIRRFSRKEG